MDATNVCIEVEVWKDIPEYEAFYQVSNMGRVRSLTRLTPLKNVTRIKNGRVLAASLKKTINGKPFYPSVILSKNRAKQEFLVHRLVALAFLPNPNCLPQVNHKNGQKGDNRVDNLEWCTASQNIRHAVDTGLLPPHLETRQRGSKSHKARLNEEQVKEIKEMLDHKGDIAISKIYGVALGTIYAIRKGVTWKHVS